MVSPSYFPHSAAQAVHSSEPDTADLVSESRAARQQEYAGPAQFKTFVTQPNAVPHHDRIFVQGLSAALRAPA